MSEYTSGVKFESRQAERNIDSFARKIGQLASAARNATGTATALASGLDRTIKNASTAGVNMDKLAKGTASFSKDADSAAKAARGLVGALSPGKIAEMARAMGTLQGRASGAATAIREAGRSAGSLATQAGRAAQRVTAMGAAIGAAGREARSASNGFKAAFGQLDTAKIANAVRLMGGLARGLNSGQQRMGTFAADANRVAAGFSKIGQSSTVATRGINRVDSALASAIPNMRMAAAYASQLQSNLGKLGNTPRVSFAAPTGMPRGGSSSVPNASGYSTGAKQATKELSDLGSKIVDLRNIARYYLTGLGVVELGKMADSVNLVRARLTILTDDVSQQARAERELQSVTLRTRTNYDDNAKLFVKLGQAGKAYGVNLGQAMTVTENVAKALKISGASAQETSSTITQLSQAFASGKLQGDELRSVLENSPRLAQAFGEKLAYMGVNLSNVRKFAKEGKIGIQEMVKVLADGDLTKELSTEFSKIPMTMSDALTQAKARLTFFMGDLDKSLGITPKFNQIIGLIADNFENIAIAAGIAGGAILLSYIPGIVTATTASAAFIGLKLAEQGLGVRNAMMAAGTAASYLGKEMTTLATGTGVARLAALPGTFGAIGTTAVAAGRLALTAFASWPVAIALATGALVAYKSEFRPIRTEMATTQDYLITAFEMISEKGIAALGGMWGEISRQARQDIATIVGALDYMYRAIKAVRGAAQDASTFGDRLKETAQYKATFGMAGKDWSGRMTDGKAAEGWNTGFAQDFAAGVRGTEWQRRANNRAAGRWAKDVRGKNIVPYSAVKGTIDPKDGKGGGKDDDKKGKTGGKSEADKLRDELESLRTSIDPVEAARKKFNDGIDTLNGSMKAGYITTAEYKTLLGQLGTDTFKGLTEDIKKLNQENEALAAKASGITIDPRILDARASIKEQTDMIDKIVAKQGDSTGELGRQKEALTGQLSQYEKIIGQNDKLTKAAEARATKEKEIADLIENALNRTQEAFVSAVDGYLTGAKSMLKGLLDLGRQTLSQYLGNALFAEVKDGLTRELKSVFKVRDKVGSAAGDSAPGKAPETSGVATTPTGVLKTMIVDGTGAPASASNDNVPGEVTVVGRRKPSFLESVRAGYIGNASGSAKVVTKTFETAVNALGTAAKKLGITDVAKKLGDKLGINTQSLGRALGRGLAGAQVGSATSDLAGMVGIKLNKTGSTLGGAVGGAVGGPIGSIIGSIGGGVIGNLFSGPKKNGSTVVSSASYGGVSSARGNDATAQKVATGLGKNVQDGLNQLAEQLGAGVGAFKVSIGTYDGDYRVSTTGQSGELSYSKKNKQKGSLVDFKDDQAGAIAFAVQTAVKQGALTGLSETSARILKQMADTERAIVLATNIEGVKRQAADIRNPGNQAMKDLAKEAKSLSDMFREAGASASDWADLNTVLQEKYKDAVEQSMSGLLAFRDSLKTGDLSYISPIAKLSAANDKFSEFEKKIASGDFSFKQEDFTNAGTSLSSIAREIYGSTPEFAAFQKRLIDATDKVVSDAQASADSYKPVVDAIQQQTTELAKQSAVTNALLQQIADNSYYGSSNKNNLLKQSSF